MIAHFKRRDGWTLKENLPHNKPPYIYNIPILPRIQFSDSLEASNCDLFERVQFELVDFLMNRKGVYIEAFYEEL